MHGVEFLLISGQASVLYGAATFSEDIDVWVRPDPGNLARLLRALTSLRARGRRAAGGGQPEGVIHGATHTLLNARSLGWMGSREDSAATDPWRDSPIPPNTESHPLQESDPALRDAVL